MPTERKEFPDWQPSGVQKAYAYTGWSYTGLMDDGCSELKYACREGDKYAMQMLYDEAARHEIVGPHDNLVVFKGIHEHGILFEYCEKGSLENVIQFQQPPLTDAEKTVLGLQVTRCLLHLHAHNLIHSDICARNVFVTAANVAKAGNLQGRLYARDSKTILFKSCTGEDTQSRHPHAGKDEYSPRTDIFALGTLLYFL